MSKPGRCSTAPRTVIRTGARAASWAGLRWSVSLAAGMALLMGLEWTARPPSSPPEASPALEMTLLRLPAAPARRAGRREFPGRRAAPTREAANRKPLDRRGEPLLPPAQPSRSLPRPDAPSRKTLPTLPSAVSRVGTPPAFSAASAASAASVASLAVSSRPGPEPSVDPPARIRPAKEAPAPASPPPAPPPPAGTSGPPAQPGRNSVAAAPPLVPSPEMPLPAAPPGKEGIGGESASAVLPSPAPKGPQTPPPSGRGGAAPAPIVPAGQLDPGFRLQAPIRPTYPSRARRLGRAGTVRLEILVNADGSVGRVAVADGSDPWGFAKAASSAFRQARFTPPRMAGRPVRVLWKKTLLFRP